MGKNLQSLIIFLAITLHFQSYKISCANCFSSTFPLSLQGTESGVTFFKVIEIDSSSNIVVGGGTSDESISSYTDFSLPTPIVLYITSAGSYQWGKQFYSITYNTMQEIISMQFNSDETKIILTPQTYTTTGYTSGTITNLIIIMLQATDGSLLQVYIDTSHTYIQLFPSSLMYDDPDIYVAMTSSSQWNLMRIESDMTVSYFQKISTSGGYTSTLFYSAVLDSDNIYITGIFRGSDGYYVAITSFDKYSGDKNFMYGNNQEGSGKLYTWRQLSIYSNYAFGCGENIQSWNSMIFYKISLNGDSAISNNYELQFIIHNLYLFFRSSSDLSSHYCLGITGLSSDISYALISRYATIAPYVAIVKSDFSWNTLKIYKFDGYFDHSANIFYDVKFSSTSAYFVGSIALFDLNSSTNKSFNKYVGLIMKLQDFTSTSSQDSTCINYSITWENLSTDSWDGWFSPISTVPITVDSNTVISDDNYFYCTDINFSYVDDSYCSGSTSSYTIVTPSYEDMIYYVDTQTGITSYEFEFSIETYICDDLSFTFYVEWSNQTSIDDSFLTYSVDDSKTKLTLDWSTATTEDKGSYTINITAVLPNGEWETIYPNLFVKNYCEEATIEASLIDDLNYTLNEIAISYTFAEFTTNPEGCSVVYQISVPSQLEGIVSLPDQTQPTIVIIQFNDASLVDLHTISVIATIELSSDSETVDFYLNILHECTSAIINSQQLDEYYYDISMGTISTIAILGWSINNLNCEPLTYSLVILEVTTIFQLTEENEITIQTSSESDVGTYTLEITGSYETYVSQTISTIVYVTNNCSMATITTSQISDQEYYITNSELRFTFDEWSIDYSFCGPFVYTYNCDDTIKETVIIFDSTDLVFTVHTTDIDKVGKYKIKVFGSTTAKEDSFEFYLTLYDPCSISDYYTIEYIQDQTYSIGSGTKYFYQPEWECSLTICDELTYTAYYNGDIFEIENVATYSSTKREFQIETSDYSLKDNSYTVEMSITSSSYGGTYSFDIILSCQTSSLSPQDDDIESNNTMKLKYYQLYSGETTITFQKFLPDQDCGFDISYSFYVEHQTSIPEFITSYNLESDPKQIVVKSDDQNDINLYNIIVTGTLTNQDNSEISATLTIPLYIICENSGPPQLKNDLQEIIRVQINATTEIKFPDIEDPDFYDTASLYSINWGGLNPSYVIGDYPQYKITPTSQDKTEYTVILTFSDDNCVPLQSSYQFSLVITNFTVVNINDTSLSNYTSSLEGKEIKSAQNSSLKAKIKSISNQGLVNVEFLSTIFVPYNYTYFNESVLNIKVSPGEFSNELDLNITNWTIVSIYEDKMNIQLTFQNPDKISQQVNQKKLQFNDLQSKDYLQIIFITNGNFIDKSTLQPIAYKYKITKYIQRQIWNDCKFTLWFLIISKISYFYKINIIIINLWKFITEHFLVRIHFITFQIIEQALYS